MTQWLDYWRIVRPQPSKENYYSGQGDFNLTYTATDGSWYSNVMKGPASRLQRYSTFDNMDYDSDVARALDTIAEEMSTNDQKTGLPFTVTYLNDDNKEVEESIVITVKAALRHWSEKQELYDRMFRVCRNTVKYGDTFFRKASDHKKWRYIDPREVIGIELDDEGNTINYHTRKIQNNGMMAQEIFEIIPSAGVVQFSLSDDMGSYAPFGESILLPVIKAHKQKCLLEDATVIYRIVRAPERRVFYIDVGNMAPQKVKEYLEKVKNEMRQKRIVTGNQGYEDMDSVYNPMSIGEDFFLSVTGNGRGSKIETLPGGEANGNNDDLKYFQDQLFRGLKVPSSYMQSAKSEGASEVNDGKVAVAYIEELRFANFIRRLQIKVQQVFDFEFKRYLKSSGINVDENLFKLELPEPQNFGLYRQAAINTELMSAFTSADAVGYLSKRYVLKQFLGMSEDDIQTNEALLRQERNIPYTNKESKMSDLQMMYDPAFQESRKVEAPKGMGGLAGSSDAGLGVEPNDDLTGGDAPEPDDMDLDAAFGGGDTGEAAPGDTDGEPEPSKVSAAQTPPTKPSV